VLLLSTYIHVNRVHSLDAVRVICTVFLSRTSIGLFLEHLDHGFEFASGNVGGRHISASGCYVHPGDSAVPIGLDVQVKVVSFTT